MRPFNATLTTVNDNLILVANLLIDEKLPYICPLVT